MNLFSRRESKNRMEDWRSTNELEWRTVGRAGDYVTQCVQRKYVRFPDGAERWMDELRSNGAAIPMDVSKSRTVKATEAAKDVAFLA